MFEYIEHQSRGIIELLKNLINRKEIYFFTFVILFLINIYLFRKVEFLQTTKIEFVNKEGSVLEEDNINVEISGAINKPGVYSLYKDSLIVDLVKQGGGFASNVSNDYIMKNLNLASKLTNNSKIYIPFIWDDINTDIPTISSFFNSVASVENMPNVMTGNEISTEELRTNSVFQIESFRKTLLDISGIGEKYAERIIIKMPFIDETDFDDRCDLPSTLCDKVKKIMKYGVK